MQHGSELHHLMAGLDDTRVPARGRFLEINAVYSSREENNHPSDTQQHSRFPVVVGCLFIFLLIHTQVSSVGGQDTAGTQLIKCTNNNTRSLYDGVAKALWNNTIRPVSQPSEVMNVKVGFTVLGILGVNEKDELMTIFVMLTFDWFVPFLRWNNTGCGTDKISYPKSDLWLPDIQIVEFMDEDKSPPSQYIQMNYTGGLHLAEPKRVVSTCKINIYQFPFDTQNCSLTFASTLHEEDEMKLTSKSSDYILNSSNTLLKTNVGWKLIEVTQNITSYTLTSKRRFSAITYFLVLKRQPSLYVVNLLVPSSFLSLLDVFSFFLPPQNVDRSAFKMTLILGYTVFLIITNDLLPDSSAETPLINVFFSLSLALMVASLLETMLIINLSNSSNYYPRVPRWLHVLVLRYLARLLFMSQSCHGSPITLTVNPQAKASHMDATLGESARAPGSGEREKVEGAAVVDELKKLARDVQIIRLRMEKHRSPNSNDDEWKLIANIIDRFLFLLYIVFMIVSYITITALWLSNFNFE